MTERITFNQKAGIPNQAIMELAEIYAAGGGPEEAEVFHGENITRANVKERKGTTPEPAEEDETK